MGKIARIEEIPDGRLLVYSRGGEESALEVETVVFAVGWPGNADDLNLAAVGVEIGWGGHVRVDDTLRTSSPLVFARSISRTLGLVPLASTGGDGSERLRAAEWELRSG